MRSPESLITSVFLCWVTHACLTSMAGLVFCQYDALPTQCSAQCKCPFIKCNWWYPDDLVRFIWLRKRVFSLRALSGTISCLLYNMITDSMSLLQSVPSRYTEDNTYIMIIAACQEFLPECFTRCYVAVTLFNTVLRTSFLINHIISFLRQEKASPDIYYLRR